MRMMPSIDLVLSRVVSEGRPVTSNMVYAKSPRDLLTRFSMFMPSLEMAAEICEMIEGFEVVHYRS